MKRLLPATRNRIQEYVATILNMRVGRGGHVSDGMFFDPFGRTHTVHVGGLRRGSSLFDVEVVVEANDTEEHVLTGSVDVADAATWIDLVPQLTALVNDFVRWRAELPMPVVPPPAEPLSALDRLLGPDFFEQMENPT